MLAVGACGVLVIPAAAAANHTNVPAPAAAYASDWSGSWRRLEPTAPRTSNPIQVKPGWPADSSHGNGSGPAAGDAGCLPLGVPRFMEIPHRMELVPQPHQFTIFSDREANPRRIYLDGRGHPAVLWPTFNGHSIGHWEADTLVVETVSLQPDMLNVGVRLSDKARVVERMRMVDADTWEDLITVEDSVALQSPWSQRIRYARVAAELEEYVCAAGDGTSSSGTSD